LIRNFLGSFFLESIEFWISCASLKYLDALRILDFIYHPVYSEAVTGGNTNRTFV